jgi:hypothetical protein
MRSKFRNELPRHHQTIPFRKGVLTSNQLNIAPGKDWKRVTQASNACL